MVRIGTRLTRQGAVLLLWAAASLSSGNAFAATPLQYYIAIQPIDVCSDTGTLCAPFNTLSKVGNPGGATLTTPIGFVDSGPGTGNTGTDITRAMWNQIGVDLAWSPIRKFNSTRFQTINVVPCSGTSPPSPCAGLTSPDFLALSQQPGISQGGTPTAPLSSQPTVINMFFVNTLNPPTQGGTLYGFSWPNNNGIAIGKNTFFPPSIVQKPRFDTLAHEIGHNLDIDHNTFGAGNSPDLMTAGCCTSTGSDLRTEPTSTTNALNQLDGGNGLGTADQLITPQQGHVALSNFLNPIASSTTTATKTSTPTITTALAVTTASGLTSITAVPGKTKPDTSIFFDVFGPSQGRDGETLIGLTVTLYPGVKFDPSNKVRFTSKGRLVRDADYDRGGSRDRDCPIADTKCLIIDLNPGLPRGQDLKFSQGIVKSGSNDDENEAKAADDGGKQPVCLADLAAAGITITYRFSDGLVITSAMTGGGTTAGANCSGDTPLTADSRQPTPTVRTLIDPGIFTSVAGALPCTPTSSGDRVSAAVASGTCPNPTQTGISDGDPSQEGGQPPPPNGG
jgi:hypothetical protein